MAKVRIIKHTADKLKQSDKLQIMQYNLQQYTDGQIHEQAEDRFLVCCDCKKLTRRGSCQIVGSCPSSRQDFYRQHINRSKGACPEGKW